MGRINRGLWAEQVRPGPGGVGRSSSRAAERVSDALRLDDSPAMRRRRWAAGLTLVASGAYAVVAAHQYGLLRHLPEPLSLVRKSGLDPQAYLTRFLDTGKARQGGISADA